MSCHGTAVPSVLGAVGDGNRTSKHFENRFYSITAVSSIFRIGIDISRFVTFLELFFQFSEKEKEPTMGAAAYRSVIKGG